MRKVCAKVNGGNVGSGGHAEEATQAIATQAVTEAMETFLGADYEGTEFQHI